MKEICFCGKSNYAIHFIKNKCCEVFLGKSHVYYIVNQKVFQISCWNQLALVSIDPVIKNIITGFQINYYDFIDMKYFDKNTEFLAKLSDNLCFV